jgi:hypothetical protein
LFSVIFLIPMYCTRLPDNSKNKFTSNNYWNFVVWAYILLMQI